MTQRTSLTYADAGVDIDAGNRLVEDIGPSVAATHRPEVLGGLGGFGGLFELPVERYRRPVLVSGTDGVGTKLRLAIDARRYDGIGIDLVAMCANDVIVSGAEPLFFLDYYATSKLDNAVAAAVVKSIAEGCKQAGAALVGGETAEMPGMYAGGDFDLAGFCVGAVERDEIIDGSRTTPGDVILGLAASGPHSNGYSLIRRVLAHSGATLDTPICDTTLGGALLQPTRIYVGAVRALQSQINIHAMAHVTGGGLAENLARVLPNDTVAQIDRNSWTWPPVFDWLAQAGHIENAEMMRTFNCGIGFVIVVPDGEAEAAIACLQDTGEQVTRIGHIRTRSDSDEATVQIS